MLKVPNIQDYFGFFFYFFAYLALEKAIEFFYKCQKFFLDENVYIKNSNFGPKLDAENSEKIGFGGTEGRQIGV